MSHAAHPVAGESVYIYGVVRAGVAAPAPVRLVDGGELAALVRDVPAEWRAASRADVEAHDRVLSEFADEPVVPMRFGIVMNGDDEVRERLLTAHADELTAMLERVDGRVQMSVKAYYLEEALLRGVLERRPELKQRADALEGRPLTTTQNERIELGHEVAAAVEEQRALDEQELIAPLAEVADDLRVESGRSERHAFTVQILIEARRRRKLDAAVKQLTAEHGRRFAIRYVGPIPPYSFCEVSLPWA